MQVSCISFADSEILETVKPNIMGKTRMDCEIIIAVGVNNRPKLPNGPFLDNNIYTKRPINTGGKLMRVLATLMRDFLSLNSFRAVNTAKVIPKIDAIKVEVSDTFKDNTITCNISLYSVKNSLINSNIISPFLNYFT